MSLFQCENCGCCENTALAPHTKWMSEIYDWTDKEALEGMELCSACSPSKFADGTKAKEYGKWHNRFERVFLPKGMFVTNRVGNLAHKETGDEDFEKYRITPPHSQED